MSFKRIILAISILFFFVSLIFYSLEYIEDQKNLNRMIDLYEWPLPEEDLKEIKKILDNINLKENIDYKFYFKPFNRTDLTPEKGKFISIKNKHFGKAIIISLKSGIKLNFNEYKRHGGYSIQLADNCTFNNPFPLGVLLSLDGVKRASYIYFVFHSLFEEKYVPRAIVILELEEGYEMPEEYLRGICQFMSGTLDPSVEEFVPSANVEILNEKGERLYVENPEVSLYKNSDEKEKNFLMVKEYLTDTPSYRKCPMSKNLKISLVAFVSGIIILICFFISNKFWKSNNQ